MRPLLGSSLKCIFLLSIFVAGLCCRVALTSQFYGKVYLSSPSKAVCALVNLDAGGDLHHLITAKILKAKRRFEDELNFAAYLPKSHSLEMPVALNLLRPAPLPYPVNSGFADPSLRPPC